MQTNTALKYYVLPEKNNNRNSNNNNNNYNQTLQATAYHSYFVYERF
jgi:hypothetical protein